MCSLIDDAIQKFENNAEKEKLANDALNAMMELAENQMDAFYLKITNGGVDTKTIPIDQILYKDYVVRVDVSSGNTDAVGSIIKKSFGNFAKGDIVDGISSIIDGGLDLLLGSFQGSVSKHELYTITTGSKGGIQRVDVRLYAYRFHAKQLTEIARNCVSCMVVISSVDAKKVSESTIRDLVQNQFPDGPQQDRILDIMLKARDGGTVV